MCSCHVLAKTIQNNARLTVYEFIIWSSRCQSKLKQVFFICEISLRLKRVIHFTTPYVLKK